VFKPRQNGVSFLPPLLREWRDYSLRAFRCDAQAGVTVAVFAVPQVMAYAMLAGLAPVQGLYAAILMSVVAALWGSSPYVNTGPTNSSALLTAAALASCPGGDPVTVLLSLTVMVGLFRVAAGGFRLGWIIRYVPESAFLGFTLGAGVLIAIGQTHHLLGVPAPSIQWVPARLVETLRRLPEAGWAPLLTGLGVLTAMLLLDRFARRWPVAVLAVAGAAGVAALLGPEAGIRLVRDLAPISGDLPHFGFRIAGIDQIAELFPAAVALAVIGLMEAISIGEHLAIKNRKPLNINQEFVGQGLSQIATAFFQGFPGSGSFSRSALIEQVGGQTAGANVVFGVVLVAGVLGCPGLLGLIPVAALAGLLVYVGLKLVDVRRIRRVFDTSRTDVCVMIVTFIVTVFVNIQYGLFAGVVTGVLLYVNRGSGLRAYELVPEGMKLYGERPYEGDVSHERSDVVAVALHGDLFFGAAQVLREQLGAIAREQKPSHLILRMRRVYSIDYSCWNALFDFAEAFHEQGGKLYICGVREDVGRVIRDAGMDRVLAPDQIYASSPVPFQAFDAAVRRVLGELPSDATLGPAWDAHRRRLAEG